MNDVILTLKGILIGLAISAPIGPVGVLVLRRAMVHGFGAGIVTGLGAAIADGALTSAIAFGLTSVAEFFDHWVGEFKLFGGFFLLCIGWWVWHTSPPHELKPLAASRASVPTLLTAVALTLSNPMTILGITGVFAGLGVVSAIDTRFHAAILVAGVFIGSLGWWFILCGIGRMLRENTSGTWMRRINQGCGILLALIGAVQLALLGLKAFGG